MDDLDAFERWMVRSNLKHIREEGEDASVVIATLHANGYHRVANAVAAQLGTAPRRGEQ